MSLSLPTSGSRNSSPGQIHESSPDHKNTLSGVVMSVRRVVSTSIVCTPSDSRKCSNSDTSDDSTLPLFSFLTHFSQAKAIIMIYVFCVLYIKNQRKNIMKKLLKAQLCDFFSSSNECIKIKLRLSIK